MKPRLVTAAMIAMASVAVTTNVGQAASSLKPRSAKFTLKEVSPTKGIWQVGTAKYPGGKTSKAEAFGKPVESDSSKIDMTVVFKPAGGTITVHGVINSGPGKTAADYTMSGKMKVTKATGKFKGAKGTLTVNGKGKTDLSASSMTFTGSLS
jgi:hypothetical protein